MSLKHVLLPALCALVGLSGPLAAASLPAAAAEPPLAIYYSFESAPPAVLFAGMRSELARILAPAGLQVAWRSLAEPITPGESFREVVVLRFRGACLFDAGAAMIPGSGKTPLAETDLSDGRVLPFGEVECDQLRAYIGPGTSADDFNAGNAALGRAMARVAAHEIYHMLTGSGAHARAGIAKAEHTRAELTAATFDFARPETDWLRAWVAGGAEPEAASASIRGGAAPDGDVVPDSGPIASR